MQNTRKFLITTTLSPDGIVYYYSESGLFVGVKIMQETLSEPQRKSILNTLHTNVDAFLSWAKMFSKDSGAEVVELQQDITFNMFWTKYNDKDRSSKKRSLALWTKLDKANQVKAYYHYDKYNRKRGNAEKKYCETYLSAELWNN